MRPHRRRTPVDHVLIAGDVQDVPAISHLLGLLSADCYGQVLVEAPAGATLPPLPKPPRVTITRIATAEGALTAAIDAWVSEWMPEEPDEDRAVAIWVGAHASSHVNARCHVLGELVERI